MSNLGLCLVWLPLLLCLASTRESARVQGHHGPGALDFEEGRDKFCMRNKTSSPSLPSLGTEEDLLVSEKNGPLWTSSLWDLAAHRESAILLGHSVSFSGRGSIPTEENLCPEH